MTSAGDIAGLRLLGHSDLGGPGDGMQIMYSNDHIYVGRPSPGTPLLIVNVSNPAQPAGWEFESSRARQLLLEIHAVAENLTIGAL